MAFNRLNRIFLGSGTADNPKAFEQVGGLDRQGNECWTSACGSLFSGVRFHLKRLTEEKMIPNLIVLSYNEILPDINVESLGMVSIDEN